MSVVVDFQTLVPYYKQLLVRRKLATIYFLERTRTNQLSGEHASKCEYREWSRLIVEPSGQVGCTCRLQ